jgi:hypothetical protein
MVRRNDSMKNYLTISCLTHIQDSTTGLHTFVNCIENAIVSSIPEVLPGFIVISKWIFLENKEGLNAVVICHRPDGSEDVLASLQGIRGDKGHLTITIQLDQIEVKEVGTHYVQVKLQEGDSEPCFGHKYPISISRRKNT